MAISEGQDTSNSGASQPVPAHVIETLERAFADKTDGYENTVLMILKKYPSLASPDNPQVLQHFAEPLIFKAIENESPKLVNYFLNAGATPNTENPSGITVLLKAIMGEYTPARALILNTLLDHPQCSLGPTRAGVIPAVELSALLSESYQGSQETGRKALVKRIINGTPDNNIDEVFQHHLENTLSWSGNINDSTTIFLLRTWAERGIDVNAHTDIAEKFLRNPIITRGNIPIPSAFLATGLDETNNPALTQRLNVAKERGRDIRKTARAVLMAELNAFENSALIEGAVISPEEFAHFVGDKAIEKLLFTPEGRATWQAQGLAVQHMLEPLFIPQKVSYFGTLEKQRETAQRLHAALPESLKGYFHPFPPLLREEALARPNDSAMVSYVHGNTAQRESGL